MKTYQKISYHSNLCTTEQFIGESLEEKIRRTTESGAPIEAISPMVYTERKEGVRADTDIRTDKWAVAQKAMQTITQGARQKREERLAQPKSNEKITETPKEQ